MDIDETYLDLSSLDIYIQNHDISIYRSNLYDNIINTYLDLEDDIISEIKLENDKTKQFLILNLLFREQSAIISNLYKNIFDINDRCINIENLLLELKTYRKYIGDEINMYGDVFTDNKIVNEMLDSLPKNVWINPNKKWFNPANGMGSYTINVILRLMDSLKDWEKDINKRYKHIVENMIYVCELQPINMLIYISLIDPNTVYKLNTYCGSFIDNDFDRFKNNIWATSKFNMTFGNPPYNDSRGDNNRSKDIFQQFVTKSRLLSKNILMLTPARWFIKEYYTTEFRYNMVNKFNLKYLIRYDDNKYLKDVDVKGGFCYFLLTEKSNRKIMISNINHKIPSRPINIKQNYLSKFLTKHGVLPNFMDDRTFRLIRKVEKLPIIEKLYNSARHFEIKTNSSELKDIGTHKCYVSSKKGLIKYIDNVKKNSKIDRYKLLLPAAAHKGKMSDNFYTRMVRAYPGEVCNESFVFFDFETEKEMISFESYMKTEFISFLVRSRKISQHVNESIFGWVPLIPFDRIWTNEEIYKHFKISKRDIKFIEKITK